MIKKLIIRYKIYRLNKILNNSSIQIGYNYGELDIINVFYNGTELILFRHNRWSIKGIVKEIERICK